MPMIQTDSQHYTDIADAIRDQNGTQDVYYPEEMASAVRAIGNVSDVTVNGSSVVDANKVAVITVPTELDDLSDVNVTSVSDGNALLYDANSGEWVPGEAGRVDDVQVNGTSVVTNKIAQVKSHKQISQNDYDNLPDSKNSDGILYCVPDGGDIEGDRFCPIIYSNNERIIGVWTDGKPLYQKTITLQLVNNTGAMEANYPHGIANIDLVPYVSCVWNRPRPLDASYAIGVTANANNIQVESGRDRHNSTLHVTIRYTKTTDTPGSGIWGPDGIPMVHYDDTERIIGTWFGETLYQKSYNVTSPSAVNTNALIISLSGIEVVNFFGLWGGRHPINFFYGIDNSISTWINAAKTYMVTRTPYNDYLNVPGIITIQYTKTT